jgi:rhodanese-related sulfurtransferase
MKRKMMSFMTALIVLLVCTSLALAQSSAPSDEKKRTEAGKYATALQAYDMWKANPAKVKILDCRTTEEYVFVGHAPMAFNIPSKLWTGNWDGKKKDYVLSDNPDFESQAKKTFSAEDTILVMCRSGHRSAQTVNRLTKAGFKNVYNIIDGFEGDKVKDAESYSDGKRVKNGWRNFGAPWTYDLDEKFLYALPK